MLESWIQRVWAKLGDIKIFDLNDDFFLIIFFHENDYNHALHEALWLVADHYLLAERWRLLIKTVEKEVKKIVVWVHIPKLLAELYNQKFR